jgi:hypothetical protein
MDFVFTYEIQGADARKNFSSGIFRFRMAASEIFFWTGGVFAM